MKMNKNWLVIILSVLIFSSFLPSVKADGMILPRKPPYNPIDESQQVAAINYQNGLEKMIISVNFDMKDMSEAVWIFPIPADPNKVVIDVTENFPQFSGQDVVERAKTDIDEFIAFSQMTQVYPLFFYLSTENTYNVIPLTGGSFGAKSTGASVTVYEHLEKDGITTEIVTAKTGEALYWYLNNRGYNLPQGSIPVLDDYIGKDYAFVVSWVSSPAVIQPTTPGRYSPTERRPGIFVTFPTDKIYFPMEPTSVYGSKTIPIKIYVLGFVEPDIKNELNSYTKTYYYVQDSFSYYGLSDFFGEAKPNSYTRIDISAPSKYMTDDIWFKQEAPAKATYAMSIYSTISQYKFLIVIAFILVLSFIVGALTGLLVFGNWIKYGFIGLSNLFSIVFLVIVTMAAKPKKKSEEKFRRKEEGLIPIRPEHRDIAFIVVFSIVYVIVGAIIGFLLKAPLL